MSIDNFTRILLHFDQSATVDECGNAWTLIGSPVIGASNAKFGSALQLNGSSYIQSDKSIALGGRDFTIDGWFFLSSSSQEGARIFNTIPVLIQLRCPFGSSKLRLCHNTSADFSASSVSSNDSGVDPTDRLVHFAVVYQYSQRILRLFVDGSLVAQTNNVPQYSREYFTFQLGYQQGASSEYFFTGSLDEFRVSDGIARWTSDFTPPIHPAEWEDANADTQRRLTYYKPESAFGDTCRRLVDIATADTSRIIKYVAFESAVFHTDRRLLDRVSVPLIRSICNKETACVDTCIKFIRKLTFAVHSHSHAEDSLINTFRDFNIVSATITLSERTLSDVFEFQTTDEWNINDAIRGNLLDYEFRFLVEETTLQDGVMSIKGMFDIDSLLYKSIYLDSNVVTDLMTSNYLKCIADCLGLNSNFKGYDFKHSDIKDMIGTYMTYSDMLTQLIGWTSNIPQHQVNCFIRGNTLNVIMRGFEDSVFDITSLNHTRPIVKRLLVRNLWNDANGSDHNYGDDEALPFTGTIEYGSGDMTCSLSYHNGLLKSEYSYCHSDGLAKSLAGSLSKFFKVTSRKNYSYASFASISKATTAASSVDTSISDRLAENHMTAKSESTDTITKEDDYWTRSVDSISTDYLYQTVGKDGFFLREEREFTSHKDFESDNGLTWTMSDSDSSLRQTFHVPIGNGWYATAVYVDGQPQGSSISQGKPDNRVSQYTIEQIRESFKVDDTNQTDDERSRLKTIVETRFPLKDAAAINYCVDALYWLNRKTQETVTLDLIDKISGGVPTNNHIVDFTERIKLDGHEFFLVSNRISLTTRSLKQSLTLVRWF